MKESVIDINCSENIIVIKTLPGSSERSSGIDSTSWKAYWERLRG